jgi:gas vesicle protein
MFIKKTVISGPEDWVKTGPPRSDLSKVLIGAAAGAAAGSLVAGLFTQKGVQVRSRISESSKSFANIKDKVAEIGEGIADKYEATKEGASDLLEKGKQKVGLSHTNEPAYLKTEDDSNAGSKILLGALIVSVASTIVWSFATEKGNETRKNIAKSGKNFASTFKEKVADLAENVAEQYEAAKEGAIDLLEQERQKGNFPRSTTALGGPTNTNSL